MFRVRKESLKWGEMLEIPTVGLLNDYIVHHGIHDLILIQEALREKEIAEIAGRSPKIQIKDHYDRRSVFFRKRRPFLIGFDPAFRTRTETASDPGG